MPHAPHRPGTRLDIPGAIVLFAGLSCLIGPLSFGHDVAWAPLVWLVMATGIAILAAFLELERRVAKRGGMPLIDLTLLADLCNTMKFGSLCALGGFTPYPVVSAMTHFPDDFKPALQLEAAE